MPRLLHALAPVALALLVIFGPQRSAAAQDADTAGEAEVLGRINAMRNAAGLDLLTRHPQLDAAARTHSADMAWHAMLSHVSPRTGDPAARVRATGLAPDAIAENIAQNTSPDAAHRALVASEAHRANMMNGEYTHVGLSVVPSDDGRVWVTEVFARIAPTEDATEAPVAQPTPPAADGIAELVPPMVGGAEVTVGTAPAQAPVAAPAPPASPAPEAAPVAPAPGQRRVAGYWVFSQGRWWYYPLPADARPGQRLVADPRVTGGPTVAAQGSGYRAAGYRAAGYRQGYRQGYRTYGAAPAVQPPPPGPPPAFGWSPRRHHNWWVQTR